MEALTVLGDELVYEGILAQRFEQLDYDPAEVEFGKTEARLGAFIVVHEGRAEHPFVELARLGDAFDRDSDVLDFADRLLTHFFTLLERLHCRRLNG